MRRGVGTHVVTAAAREMPSLGPHDPILVMLPAPTAFQTDCPKNAGTQRKSPPKLPATSPGVDAAVASMIDALPQPPARSWCAGRDPNAEMPLAEGSNAVEWAVRNLSNRPWHRTRGSVRASETGHPRAQAGAGVERVADYRRRRARREPVVIEPVWFKSFYVFSQAFR
jgi:hypothetical protein